METNVGRKRSLAFLGAAHALNHSMFVITPSLLSLIMTSLSTNIFEIALVSTIASFIFGTGALLGGPLGDRIGEIRMITICLALTGISTFLMLAAESIGGIYVYAITLSLMAFWASLYHPIANSLILKVFKINAPEAMGIHGVGGTVGIVLAPAMAWFVGITFGWPWAFVIFGTLTASLAVVFARTPEYRRESNTKRTKLLDALKIRALRAVLTLNIMIGLFMKGVELFFPTYLRNNRGIDPTWSSIAYTLLLAVGVAGQWTGGKAGSILGCRKTVMLTMAGVCLSLVSLLFLPFYFAGTALFVVLYGLFFYAHQPALNALVGFVTPSEQQGAVFGIYFFTSFGIGSLSQLFAGYIAELYGLDASFYLLTAFAALALLLSFRLPDEKKCATEAASSGRL
jgi:MFS family permease